MIDSNIILPSKPKIISEDGHKGAYEIEGLYPGYGHTLGNSLRRIILSSLVGTAITSVKIEGVNHEFSTLAGVKEDVIMIILNLKKIRFKMIGDEPQKVSLNVRGPKEVTAADIKTGGQIEILNGDCYLTSITDKNSSLNIEITVEKGLGYLSKEAIKREKEAAGMIYLDAAFSPIRRVSYEVENMRVGDRTDYNRLLLNIETDGTLTPHQALERSIEIMINQLKAIVGFKEDLEEVEPLRMETSLPVGGTILGRPRETTTEQEGGLPKQSSDVLKTRIEDLDLSARTIKALSAESIRTVGGLSRKKIEDLLSIPGLGEKGIQEIKKALTNFGITLK